MARYSTAKRSKVVSLQHRKAGTTKRSRAKSRRSSPFQMRKPDEAACAQEPHVHVYGNNSVCETNTRGYATPGNRSRTEIVVDAPEGSIPLWDEDVTLRWRFQEHSMLVFQDPDAAQGAIRELLGEALINWGDASPVKFTERNDAWDFEIVVREEDRCNINGCVLASAFFPGPSQDRLVLYPKMFTQSREEQIDTLMHEVGHIFGLRHFFANISETEWPSEIFGEHKPFSIMNYGSQSELTAEDLSDLTLLYQMAWSRELTSINGTSIRLVKPFSSSGNQQLRVLTSYQH